MQVVTFTGIVTIVATTILFRILLTDKCLAFSVSAAREIKLAREINCVDGRGPCLCVRMQLCMNCVRGLGHVAMFDGVVSL